jgi:hypothetical protein
MMERPWANIDTSWLERKEYRYMQSVDAAVKGFTRPLAVCGSCGLVWPYKTERFMHFIMFYFRHQHRLTFIWLIADKNGMSYRISGEEPGERVRGFLERAGELWKQGRESVEAAYENVVAFLGEALGEAGD